MIRVDRGNVSLTGSVPDLLTETTMLCRALKNVMAEDGVNETEAKEHIQRSLDLAFMTGEELDAEVENALMALILKGLVR